MFDSSCRGVHLGDFAAIVKPRDKKVRPWGVRVLDVVVVEVEVEVEGEVEVMLLSMEK